MLIIYYILPRLPPATRTQIFSEMSSSITSKPYVQTPISLLRTNARHQKRSSSGSQTNGGFSNNGFQEKDSSFVFYSQWNETEDFVVVTEMTDERFRELGFPVPSDSSPMDGDSIGAEIPPRVRTPWGRLLTCRLGACTSWWRILPSSSLLHSCIVQLLVWMMVDFPRRIVAGGGTPR